MRGFNVLRFPEFYGGQMGVPGSTSELGLRLHPDAVDYYVDSTHPDAQDAPEGGTPDAPFATIDYAVGRCTASRGDFIYVSQGHAETIAAAGGLDLDVAGITIVGMGTGDLRPTITFTATGSDVDVDAAYTTVRNLRFVSGIDAVVAMIDVNADDFWIDECEFPEVSAMQWVSAIDVNGGGANGCDGFKMTRCTVRQIAAGADQAVDIAQVQDRVVIADNVIDGDFVNAGLYSPAIFTNALIAGNVVRNRQAGDHAIEFTAACTGELVDNRLFGDTLGTILDPGSLFCAGNLESDAVDVSGVPSPLASAGPLPAGSIDASAIADDAIDAAAFANDVGQRRVAVGNYNFTDDTGAQGAYSIFAVTGDVILEYVFGVCDDALTSGGAATIELGVSGNTAVLIAQATATDLIQDEIWHDATPTTTIEQIDMTARSFVSAGGQDVIFTIGAADLTAGDIDFYVLWTPLSADADVSAV